MPKRSNPQKRGKRERTQVDEEDDKDLYIGDTKVNFDLSENFDDEEIDEDGAFNEEDFEMYGNIGKQATAEEAKEAHVDDDGEATMELSDLLDYNMKRSAAKAKKAQNKKLREGTRRDDEAHTRMVDSVTGLHTSSSSGNSKAVAIDRSQYREESELGISSQAGLTLDDLLKPMENDSRANAVRQQLRGLKDDQQAKTLEVPLSDVKQEEVSREVAFGGVKRKVSRWTGVVKQMREAEQLKFPLLPETRANMSSASLTTKFMPSNSLEKDFDSLLNQYGMNEKEVGEREGLEAGEAMDAEQRKAMQNKLKKMRSLMFHHEIKLKRMKKIKSRTYRKVHKKLKEKNKLSIAELEEIDPELAEKEKMKQETKRVQERMNLRHKNTSKWVKRQLLLAKNNPALQRETQKAIGQQLNLGNELRKKMMSAEHQDGSGSDDSDDVRGDWEEALIGEKNEEDRDVAIQKLKKSLESGIGKKAPKKGLMSMKFMQKAMQKRAAAASKLLKEFEEEHDSSASNQQPEEDVQDFSKGLNKGVSLVKGSMRNESTASGNHHVVETSNLLTVDSDDDEFAAIEFKVPLLQGGATVSSKNDQNQTNKFTEPIEDDNKSKGKVRTKVASTKTTTSGNSDPKLKDVRKGHVSTDMDNESPNPWLSAGGQHSVDRERNARSTPKHAKHQNENDSDDHDEINMDNKITIRSEKGAKIFKLSQADVVQQAFVNGGNEEKDFADEKKLIERGDEQKEEATGLPGWGSWGGDGVKHQKKRKKSAKRKVGRIQRQSRDGNDGGLKHVILNQRRNKKAKKYMVENVPFPFTSKEQYQMSLRQPLGRDWNTLSSYQEMTKPEVITKTGEIIAPITAKSIGKAAKNSQRKKRKKKTHG